MSFIWDNAVEGYDDRLAYFTNPLTNTSIEGYNYRSYNPIGEINDSAPLEFDIANNTSDHVDLSGITLTLKLCILKSDKSKIQNGVDDVTLSNLITASMFSQMDFLLQQKNINSSVGANFPYKCMFDVLLKNGKQAQKTWLAMAGFYKDSAGAMDDYSNAKPANLAFNERNKLTSRGDDIVFKTKIFSDICQQKKLLPSGIPMNLKYFPSPDLFRLLYPDPAPDALHYHVHIKEAKITIPFVRLNPGYLTAQSEILQKENALIRFTKSAIKTYTLPQGNRTWVGENLFQDSIPNQIIIGFLDSKAYAGSNTKNAYNLQTFGCNYINFEVNGQTIGSEILQPNFRSQEYTTAYYNLFDATTDQPEVPNLSYSDFGNGYGVFVYNVLKKTPGYDVPSLKGQTRLSIKFDKDLEQSVTVIVYGSFSSVLSIDAMKNVMITP